MQQVFVFFIYGEILSYLPLISSVILTDFTVLYNILSHYYLFVRIL